MPMQVFADTLLLTDGTPLQGEYRGGSPAEIRFAVDGDIQAYKVEQVQSLSIRPRSKPDQVIFPTGTVIRAQLTTAISSRRNRNGDRFGMRLLKPLRHAQITVADVGHRLVGRVARVRRARRADDVGFLRVELQEMDIDGKTLFLKSSAHRMVTLANDGVEARRGEVRFGAGSVLQFRLVQPAAVTIERR